MSTVAFYHETHYNGLEISVLIHWTGEMILSIKTTDDQGGIYAIFNTITNQRYVGQTSNFRLRWASHIKDLDQGKHTNRILQSSWRQYGRESFKFTVLEKVYSKDVEILLDRERCWMRRMDCFGKLGFNLWRS